jgi:hypothetical protein
MPYLGTSEARTTKARDVDSAAVGPNRALNGRAKQATGSRRFRDTMGECAGGRASNDDNGIGQTQRLWRSET